MNTTQRRKANSVWAGVEYNHCFPCVSYEATKRGQVPMAARVRHGITPTSSVTSTIQHWRDCGSPVKTLPLFSRQQQSPPHSIPFLIWCDILLTQSYHLPVVSTTLLLPSISSILPLYLPHLFPTCTRLRDNHHHHHQYYAMIEVENRRKKHGNQQNFLTLRI